MLVFLGFVSIAFLIGIIVGWVWRPRWVGFSDPVLDDSHVIKNQPVESNSNRNPDPNLQRKSVRIDVGFKLQDESCSSSMERNEDDHDHLLTDQDLRYLYLLVEKKDDGPPWKHMMDRSTPTMTYQAWRRDFETGPPQYRSVTVYEDATPELLRDFFWDDDSRLKWDDMLLHATTLEEFRDIGASVVHWIRRFPFLCSDREYIIGRRIWESDGSFYCVTKGVPCSLIPRKQKPRRVDVYYSSWLIRSVQSKKENKQPACEVTFIHYEEMGIPWEIARIGVRQGMWGTAKKIEQSFRLYQNERACSKTVALSRHVAMAQMSTRIDQAYLTRLESDQDNAAAVQTQTMVVHQDQAQTMAVHQDQAQTMAVHQDQTQTKGVHQDEQGGICVNVPKVLLFAGAVALACSVNRGQLTTAVVFGVVKRIGNLGRRAFPATRL